VTIRGEVEHSRVLFVNENIGGHATMHLAIRDALRNHPEVSADFIDAAPPGVLHRIVWQPIPGLARLDLDFQPLRAQLAGATWVRRRLGSWEQTYDALHVYSQNAALLSTDILRRHPSVVSTDASGAQSAYGHPYRSPTRWTATRVRLAARLERRVYDAATLVVAQSEWAATSLRDGYGVEADRLRVVPFGVVVPDVVARHDVGGLPEITWVGTSMERKGGWRLLRIFREHLRGRCRLNLVTPEPLEEEPGVSHFSGIHPGDGKLGELFSRTAVLAFPSEIDTFGYAALEAMAAGVPVVGFRLRALPEIVEHGTSGLLVDPDDDELACALGRMVDDPALCAQMGVAARARVLARFDTVVTTTQLLDVLAEARRRAGE
jgi:glycosyltransferase involved in cell wall biosynthesis